MSVKLKVAQTARELNDVFWLRHEVYVIEDRKFGGVPLPGRRIADRFDALPRVANIIAFDDDQPIGTLRLNLDTGGGLPSEEVLDFSAYRRDLQSGSQAPVVLGSASMLAIRDGWRGRRDVIRAMFKMATGIGHSWGATHGLATVNHDTVSIYERLGFRALGEPAWIDGIGNYVVPMGGDFAAAYEWAFGDLITARLDRFWLDAFAGHFERVLLSPGEPLFEEGDAAGHAYIVDDGWIQVLRRDSDGNQLTLATLSHGSLIGELALIDDRPRSATVIAGTHAELIRLSRDTFLDSVRSDPEQVKRLLRVFADRLRITDQLAMVMAYAPEAGRIRYALDRLKGTAVPDKRETGVLVARCGPGALAKAAGVSEHEVQCILELEKQAGNLDYGANVIRFLEAATP